MAFRAWILEKTLFLGLNPYFQKVIRYNRW